MFKKLFFSLLIAGLGAGGWYYWKHHPEIPNKLSLLPSEFAVFKSRHKPEEIIAAHKELLLAGSTFLEPQTHYYPLLLMDVKYTPQNKNRTVESMLLWQLSDGEMVKNTEHWHTTHGFEECLIAQVTKEEFTLLKHIISKPNNALSSLEEPHIKECIRKKLLVEDGQTLRLHFERPQFEIEPSTLMKEALVLLPEKPAHIASKKYSISKVKEFAHIVFGAHFAIKKAREVYLPVYEITVQHADGTLLKTYWNSLTGARII